MYQALIVPTVTYTLWPSALMVEPCFFPRVVTVDVREGTVSLGFQLSGYYGNYHWSPVCFESKQICFGIITGLEDVTDESDGDHSCWRGSMPHLGLFNDFINTCAVSQIGMVDVKMRGSDLESKQNIVSRHRIQRWNPWNKLKVQ